jgi:hypothetical protein
LVGIERMQRRLGAPGVFGYPPVALLVAIALATYFCGGDEPRRVRDLVHHRRGWIPYPAVAAALAMVGRRSASCWRSRGASA